MKFMSETNFFGINFHLMGVTYYFKRGQLLKYQRLNKYNQKNSGGSCPQSTIPRSVAANSHHIS